MRAPLSMPQRSIVALAFFIAAAGPTLAQDRPITLVMLGDDTVYGYGLDPADRLPARLKDTLSTEGYAITLVESPNWDSSKGGVIWLSTKSGRAVLDNPAGTAAILSLGHWDCGVMDLRQTKANLGQIIAAFGEKDIPVLLVGTRPSLFCGDAYGAIYPAIFPELATEHGVLLHEDIADPTPEASTEGLNRVNRPVAAEPMLPLVRALLAQVKD